jgi:hypothetical protein
VNTVNGVNAVNTMTDVPFQEGWNIWNSPGKAKVKRQKAKVKERQPLFAFYLFPFAFVLFW